MLLPAIILPGYLASASDYRGMEQWLNQQGIPTTTVPLKKTDWLPTLGGRSILPILTALDRTVQQVRQQWDTSEVNLIAHSAGGWIARIYLGEHPYDIHGRVSAQIPHQTPDQTPDQTYVWQAHQFVRRLITLGSPHTSQERWTRKNLDFVNLTYPGAYHGNVAYVCVAGKAVLGERRWGRWLAYSSYELTCGQGNTWGDGITPIAAAHLTGAENLVLENVWHSPRSAGPWYGTPAVMTQWVDYLRT